MITAHTHGTGAALAWPAIAPSCSEVNFSSTMHRVVSLLAPLYWLQ